MSDLSHTYTSDLTFQETFAFAADTQFSIQREGQNVNYLLDQFGPIISQLTSLDATAAKFETFNTTASGSGVIYTSVNSIVGAIFFITPVLDSSLPIGLSSTSTPIYGPPMAIAVSTTNPWTFQRSATAGGSFSVQITGVGSHDITFNSSGGGYSIYGILAYT